MMSMLKVKRQKSKAAEAKAFRLYDFQLFSLITEGGQS